MSETGTGKPMSQADLQDQVFLFRAREAGLLTPMQVKEIYTALMLRRAHEPDLRAHQLAVDYGWIDEAAAITLAHEPPSEVTDQHFRIVDENEEALEPEDLGTDAEVAQRFEAEVTDEMPKVDGPPEDEAVPEESEPAVLTVPTARADIDLGTDSGRITDTEADYSMEVPALVEPLPQGAPASSEDSVLEMELPPPPKSSGDSIFEEPDSPAGDSSEGGEAVTDPSESAVYAPLLEEKLYDSEPQLIEIPDESVAITLDDVTASRPPESIAPTSSPSDLFTVRGTKGAGADFASFGEGEVDSGAYRMPDDMSLSMMDSAVGEVMDDADDAYFGAAADLGETPQDLIDVGIAPARTPTGEVPRVPTAELPRAPEPRPANVYQKTSGSSEYTVLSDEDDDFAATGDTQVTAANAPSGLTRARRSRPADSEDITERSEDTSLYSFGSADSSTRDATGEVARVGLRKTDSQIGVESAITGSEMSLADLREKMGLGEGVKLGSQRALSKLRKVGGTTKRYAVVREIARGGMGKIIEVEDSDLRRNVALKVLRKEMLERKDLVERFLEEAQITGQLEHPNIVPVHEIGVDGRGNLYFTMKLVEGEDLASILRRLRKRDPAAVKAWPISRLVDVFIKVCEGVAFAHSRGVIHRDLKPANIMVGRFGEVQIMDWGLSKIIGRKEEPSSILKKITRTLEKRRDDDETQTETRTKTEEVPAPDDSATASGRPTNRYTFIDKQVTSDRFEESAQTMAGSILGTPSYMSPEQARGEVDYMAPTSDVFSLGVMLYEILALRTPWNGGTSEQVLDEVKNAMPKFPSAVAPERKPPPELEQLAMRCLEKLPHKRIPSAQKLIDNLRSWQEGRRLTAVSYSMFQILRKWVSRHKVAFIATIVAMVAVAGGVVATVQYFEQQRIMRGEGLLADAERTLQDGLEKYRAASSVEDFQGASTLGMTARNDARAAIDLLPGHERASGVFEAAVRLMRDAESEVQARFDARVNLQREAERRTQLEGALSDARAALATARELDARRDTSAETAAEAFGQAREMYIKVQVIDDQNIEARGALIEINDRLNNFSERQRHQAAIQELRALTDDADARLTQAQRLRPAQYKEASEALMAAITVCDRALAVSVSGGEADQLREQARTLKAVAGLEFARRAFDRGLYEVCDLMINTAASTQMHEAQVEAMRKTLDERLARQSRLRAFVADAERAYRESKWVAAQEHLRNALSEAANSPLVDEIERSRLNRMYENARLEELREREAAAATGADMVRVIDSYNELIPALTDSDYRARAAGRRDELRARAGQSLIAEADAAQGRVAAALLETALPLIDDPALNATVSARLTELKMSLALQNVADHKILLPRGEFIVGSNREGDQNPQRSVTQDEFLYLDKHLVSNRDFKAFVDDNGYKRPELWHPDARALLPRLVDTTGKPGPAGWADGRFDASQARFPVTGVCWFEADAYARWSGRRLPTAVEWEVAAGAPRRGDTTTPPDYPFGPRESAPVGGVPEPREIGTAEWDRNRLGVRDMGSNVAEWTGSVQAGRAVVKGAEPGLRAELFLRYARRSKNSTAELADRSTGRGFRCASVFTVQEPGGTQDG